MTETAVAQERRWIALILLCVAEFMVVLDGLRATPLEQSKLPPLIDS